MKVSVYLVTYEGDKRTEALFKDLSTEEKKNAGKQLTDAFMKRAGFSPVPG